MLKPCPQKSRIEARDPGNSFQEISGLLNDSTERLQSLIDSQLNSTHLPEVIGLEDKICNMLRTVRPLRNRLAPINRLPTELLCLVFTFLHDDVVTGPFSRPDGLKEITNLSQTCQRWRDAAFSFPSLWSHIAISTLPTFISEELLKRSRGSPLSVVVSAVPRPDGYQAINSSFPHKMLEAFRLVAGHSDRFKELKFDISTCGTRILIQQLTTSLPILETLRCRGCTSLHRLSETYTKFPSLPVGTFPRLKNLSLEGFISWPLGLFVNLTSVELSCLQPTDAVIKLQFFLDFLERSPQLKNLKFIHRSMGQVGRVEPSRVVSLERLAKFTLQIFDTPSLLSHLSLPPTVQVTVFVGPVSLQSSITMAGLHNIFPKDVSRLLFLKNLVHLGLDVDERELKLGAINNQGGAFSVGHVLDGSSGGDQFGAYLASLSSHDLSQLRKLAMRRKSNYCRDPFKKALSESVIRRLYKSAPLLTEIKIIDPCCETVLRPLTICGSGGGEGCSGILCPFLTNLYVAVTTSDPRARDVSELVRNIIKLRKGMEGIPEVKATLSSVNDQLGPYGQQLVEQTFVI